MQSTQLSLSLQGDAFAPGPAGDAFYATPALNQRLDTLHHLTQFSDHFLAILSPAETGKSSLVEEFLSQAGPHWHICQIDDPSNLDMDGLLAELLATLDVVEPFTDSQDALALLGSALELTAARDELLVVTVDDAENLTEPALNLLCELAARSEHLKTRVVLAATRGFLPRLKETASDAGAESLLYTVDLPTFDLDETHEYLSRRLSAVGMAEDSLFSESIAAEIHTQSGGVPGAINRLALGVMSKPTPPEAPSNVPVAVAPSPRWGRWLAGVGVTVAVLLFVFVGLAQFASEPPQPVPNLASVPSEREQGPQSPPSVLPPPVEPAPKPTRATQPDRQPVPQPEPVAVAKLDPDVLAPIIPVEVPATVPVDAYRPVHAAVPIKAAPTSSADRVAVAGPVNRPASGARSDDRPINKVQTEPTPNANRAPQGDRGASAVKRDKAPVESRAPASNQNQLVQGRDWIERQRADAHTIQILGTHNYSALSALVRKQNLGSRAATYRTVRQGKTWYGLVYGAYPSRAAALAAAKALDPALTNGKPWIRTFRDIQASLP